MAIPSHVSAHSAIGGESEKKWIGTQAIHSQGVLNIAKASYVATMTASPSIIPYLVTQASWILNIKGNIFIAASAYQFKSLPNRTNLNEV